MSLLDIYENIFDYPFLRSPENRGLLIGGSVYLGLYLFKPSYFYDENGNERPSSFLSDREDAIRVTAPMVAAFTGMLFAVI